MKYHWELGQSSSNDQGRRRHLSRLDDRRLGLDALGGAVRLVVALVLGSLDGHPAHHAEQVAGRLGNAWVELFRNIPLLVQIFLWYHVMPGCYPRVAASRRAELHARRRSPSASSPRRASPSRCGPASSRLPRGQRYAGLAIGLDLPQTYRYVLLPMAFRIVIPPLTSASR